MEMPTQVMIVGGGTCGKLLDYEGGSSALSLVPLYKETLESYVGTRKQPSSVSQCLDPELPACRTTRSNSVANKPPGPLYLFIVTQTDRYQKLQGPRTSGREVAVLRALRNA